MTVSSGNVLGELLVAAQARVQQARRRRPLARPTVAAPHPHRLCAALCRRDGVGLALIAEIKRASPSRGDIAPGLDAVAQAQAYAAAGADALSVLTEPTRFEGSLADLEAVTAACRLPVLRKDFIVDPYQVWESSAAGAAAVLLIVAALDDAVLRGLLGECRACRLDALVEVHTEADVERALTAGASLIGINNRDLRTLAVDLGTTERLAPRVPAGVLVVSESGIVDARGAARAAAAGAHALLVGEALMRAPREGLPALVHGWRAAAEGVLRTQEVRR